MRIGPPCAPFSCSFCRKRFYGENELFQHMHSAHEQCFLCKRGNPHKYVYYRDYADLESESFFLGSCTLL